MSDRGFLTGEHILLRGIRRTDVEAYRHWLDHSEITYFMEMGARPTSDADLEEFYRLSTESAENVVFAIVHKDTNKPMGIVGLYAINWICRRGDFRIIIGETDLLGQGMGTEAAHLVLAYGFETLNLEVVTLGVNTENKRAIGSYKNAGFVAEGTRRKLIYRNSRYYDVLQMSVLREEYYSNKSTDGT